MPYWICPYAPVDRREWIDLYGFWYANLSFLRNSRKLSSMTWRDAEMRLMILCGFIITYACGMYVLEWNNNVRISVISIYMYHVYQRHRNRGWLGESWPPTPPPSPPPTHIPLQRIMKIWAETFLLVSPFFQCASDQCIVHNSSYVLRIYMCVCIYVYTHKLCLHTYIRST